MSLLNGLSKNVIKLQHSITDPFMPIHQKPSVRTLFRAQRSSTSLISLFLILIISASILIWPDAPSFTSERINVHAKNHFVSENKIQINQIQVEATHKLNFFSLTQKPHTSRFLQTNQQTSKSIQNYVMVIIIFFFIGVPGVVIVVFLTIFIYKKCTQQQVQENYNRQAGAQINLEEYNIDEIGPYLVNSRDQCSICLDNEVNIRTLCGHFFHAPCLKAWFQKKAQQIRPATCPVCVGSVTNPIKIYCKKCFVSVRLDKLIYTTNQSVIAQIDSTECNSCKKPQNETSFTQSSANESPQINKETPPNKQLSNPENLTSFKQKNGNNLKIQKHNQKSTKFTKKPQKQFQKPNVSDRSKEQMQSQVKIHANREL